MNSTFEPRRLTVPGLRAAVAAFLVLGLLCLLLPFETEYRASVNGIDLVRGAGSVADREVAAEVPAATVAFAFAAAAVVFALLPGITAAAAAMLAAGFSAAALFAVAMSVSLRPGESVVGMRYGYWLALLLIGGAVLSARRRWRRLSPARTGGGAGLAVAGALLLLAGALVPGTLPTSGEEIPTGLPVAPALDPNFRASAFWGAIAALALPFLVLLATRVLPSARAAAPALAALGAGGALAAAASLLLASSAAYRAWSDGAVLVLAGSVLVLSAGVTGARAFSPPERRMRPISRVLAAAGAALAVVAVFVPYDGGGAGSSLALLERELSASSWLALPPIALALLTLAVAAAGSRRYGDALLGLAAGLAVTFLPLLYPLLDNEGVSSFAPGAAIGLLGALVIAAGGAVELGIPRMGRRQTRSPLVDASRTTP